MFLEGVSALRKEFRPYVNYGIFVQAPLEVCLERGFKRDQGVDGKSDAEVRSFWKKWYEAEETYMSRDNPQAYADLVVDGTKPFVEQMNLAKLTA